MMLMMMMMVERERERERERCRRVMMSQQPGKKEGVHMVQKIGTTKKKRKKKTIRNSNARVALAKKAKRSEWREEEAAEAQGGTVDDRTTLAIVQATVRFDH
jgi:DNA invertase Pin-like site-specific DNA recombinase